MKNITINEAEKNIYESDVYEVMDLLPKSNSYAIKIILLGLFSIFISLPSLNYYWELPLLCSVIISIMVIKYLSFNSFQKVVNYDGYMYLILQTGILFFMTVFLYVNNDNKYLFPIGYVIFGYTLSFFIVYFKLLGFLKTKYKLKINYAKRGILFAEKTTKLLAIAVSFSILLILLYRINRWWLMDAEFEFNNTSLLEYIIWGISLLLILVVLTLLPTLLIKPDKLIKYKLIEKYAEEFRERYDYSKKDWYGK